MTSNENLQCLEYIKIYIHSLKWSLKKKKIRTAAFGNSKIKRFAIFVTLPSFVKIKTFFPIRFRLFFSFPPKRKRKKRRFALHWFLFGPHVVYRLWSELQMATFAPLLINDAPIKRFWIGFASFTLSLSLSVNVKAARSPFNSNKKRLFRNNLASNYARKLVLF